MLWRIVLCLATGYLCGCFSTAYIVGKIYNVDIRKHGSGNAGTTNALRILGKKAAAITFIGDFLKALLPILIFKYIIFKGYEEMPVMELYIGIGVVIGHNYPFWLKFKGGKGIAATAGVYCASSVPVGIIGGTIFAIVALITKYVSLSSLIALTSASCILIYLHHDNLQYIILIVIFTLFAYWRHKENIVRLIKGTENKMGGKPEIDIKNMKKNNQ